MTVDQTDEPSRRSKRKLALFLIAVTAPVWMLIGFGGYNLRTAYVCLMAPTPTQDVATCEDALSRPLSLGPLHTMLALKLAEAHKAKGTTDAAMKVLSDEVQRDPDSSMARSQLAAMLRDKLDYQAAAENYLILHKAHPENLNHFSNALTSLSEAGRAAEAVALAQPFAEKHNDAWSWEWLGWVQQKAEEFDAAAVSYGKASALDPTQHHLLTWQGYSLEMAGKNDDAMKAYDKAVLLAKTTENISYRIALNAKLGNLDAVRADHELTLTVDPSATNKANYARFLMDELDYRKADELLREARAAEPTHYSVLDQTVRAKILLGEFAAARAAIEDFKSINPEEGEVIYWQAFLEDEMGNEMEAIKAYKKALVIWPTWGRLHADIGHSLVDLKLAQVSLQWFDKAIELDAASADFLTGRARAYLYLDMPTKALVDADKALTLDPRMAMAHARRASALEQLDRNVEAIVSYEEAVKRFPTLAWVRNDYASLLERMGQKVKADKVRAAGKAQ
jgi:tetratricopeptide (TPR) repeat protein